MDMKGGFKKERLGAIVVLDFELTLFFTLFLQALFLNLDLALDIAPGTTI